MPKLFHTAFSLSLTVMLAACATTSDIQKVPPQDSVTQAAEVISLAASTEEQLEKLKKITSDKAVTPKLGRGDVLNVSVYDEPELNINGIPIRPDGRISFPLVGDVIAEGLTVSELNDSLTTKLSRFILSPKVSVIVQNFNSQQFTIFGEVVKPGVYPLITDISITEALAGAGGLNKGQFRATSVELADLTHAFIARQGEVLPVDFVRLIRQGDLRYDNEIS